MAKSPDQIVADIDRKQNEEDLDLPRRVVSAITPTAVKQAAKYISKSEFDTDKRKPDNGVTTNAMGDKYAKGGSVSSASKRADGCCVKGKTKGRMV